MRLIAGVPELADLRKLADLPKPRVETLDTIARTGYKIEKLVIRPEEGISLPTLLFLPDKRVSRVVLYLNDKGKAADAGVGGPIEKLVLAGAAVLAVDLRGNGQTQSTTPGLYGPDFQDAQIAYMLGRSVVGMRAEDVLLCGEIAAEQIASVPDRAVDLVAVGNIGISALHAAALEPALFDSVKLRHMLVSWSNVVYNRMNTSPIMASLIHGALQHYDLPNLEATLGEKLTIEEPVDVMGVAIKQGK